MADRAEVSQDVSTLQRRGRRRLVGAIALVLLSVIVLPMVFDPDPKPAPPPVSVRIPGEDESRFVPKVVPKGAASTVVEVDKTSSEKAPEAVAVAPTAPTVPAVPEQPKPDAKPVPPKLEPSKPALKVEPKPAPAKTAPPPATPATPATSGQFYVQVGAFAEPLKVREVSEKLKGAKLVHYTESVATAGGSVTRIRLGPYASKEAAEKAREAAKGLGLSPANPVVK